MRLEARWPFIGPCLVCGGPDKRHRLFDAILENLAASDSVELVARLYDLTTEEVELITVAWDPSRGARKDRTR